MRVARRRGGVDERAGVGVDPEREERRLDDVHVERAALHLLDEQRRHRADLLDALDRGGQVVVGGGVVVPDGHAERRVAARDAIEQDVELGEAAHAAHVDDDEVRDGMLVDVGDAQVREAILVEREEVAHAAPEAATEGDVRVGVELLRGDRGGERVEVGHVVGDDELHDWQVSTARAEARAGAAGRGVARVVHRKADGGVFMATTPDTQAPYFAPTLDEAHGASWLRFLPPFGRVFYAFIFIVSGFTHFSAQTVAYARGAGVPFPEVAVPVAGLIAIAGGLSIALGWHARVGAWLLVLFLVPVTLMMHRFWAAPDPQQARLDTIMFMKNLSMLGAALFLAYAGAGPFSLDARTVDGVRGARDERDVRDV